MKKEKFRNLFFKYKVHLVLFWVILYIALVIRQNSEIFYIVSVISNFTFLTVTGLYSYFVLFKLLPRYGYTRKFLIFLPALVVSFLLVTVVNAYVDQVVFVNYAIHPVKSGFTWRIPEELIFTFLTFTSFAGFKIADDYFRSRWENERIQNEILTTELQYLRSQLEPHFLFNMLNNLNFMIQKNPEKASGILLKLSDMLRYHLYETNSEKTSLAKEIENISNYIELERIRHEDNVSVCFKPPSDINGYMISPHILLPLVENAFKHLSRYETGVNKIEILLSCDSEVLDFEVSNSTENMKESLPIGGIGLKNLKRRLELLYKDKYEFKAEQVESFYKVNLRLKG